MSRAANSEPLVDRPCMLGRGSFRPDKLWARGDFRLAAPAPQADYADAAHRELGVSTTLCRDWVSRSRLSPAVVDSGALSRRRRVADLQLGVQPLTSMDLEQLRQDAVHVEL